MLKIKMSLNNRVSGSNPINWTLLTTMTTFHLLTSIVPRQRWPQISRKSKRKMLTMGSFNGTHNMWIKVGRLIMTLVRFLTTLIREMISQPNTRVRGYQIKRVKI